MAYYNFRTENRKRKPWRVYRVDVNGFKLEDGMDIIVSNLAQFCKDRGLDASKMRSVAYGNRKKCQDNEDRYWVCEAVSLHTKQEVD